MRASVLAVAGALFALLWAPVAGAWSWPVDGPVLRPFAFGSDPYLGGQHRGIDIGGPAGAAVAAVVAPVSGLVSFVGSVPGGGTALTIRTNDGYSATLVHLGSISALRGSVVLEGAAVGSVGPSGDAETPEPYVHFGVRVTAEAHGYVDPLSLLPPRQPRPAPVAPSAGPVPAAPAAGTGGAESAASGENQVSGDASEAGDDATGSEAATDPSPRTRRRRGSRALRSRPRKDHGSPSRGP